MNEARRKVVAQRAVFRPAEHARALQLSVQIATNLRRLYHRKMAMIQPHDVIKVLNGAGIKFTLVGAHGIAGWLDEPRATQDVDVLVQSNFRKAVQVLKKAYPKLTVQVLPAVTRFLDPTLQLPVIDLMQAQARLHKAVPKHVHQIGNTHRIPDLEMALALKYAALESPNRTMKKRLQDKADFLGMVAKNYEIIDTDKLARLGELLKAGGGKALRRMVEDAHAEAGPDPHG